MSFSRRTFFRGALLLGTGATLAACSTSQDGDSYVQPTPRGYDSDPRPLPIPPLLKGDVVDGVRVFTLTAQDGHAEILPGVSGTRTWGFNGDFLGPTLRARKGEKVRAEITNDLIEMTTVHWHGMKLPAYCDGGPHSPIQPGQTWKPEWEIAQPAATTWYHPHPHLATATHAYRGLAGLFILDDDVSEGLDLPHEYGVDDIPVVLMDAKFSDDGQLDEKIDSTYGLMGTTPLVNGIANAAFDATTRRVRLRLLNGASMRFYNLSLSAGSFYVIATDSGLLGAPAEADSLILGPGERAEILIDLAADATLRSTPFDGNFGVPDDAAHAGFGFGDSFDVLQLRAAASAADAAPVPEVLDPAAAADLAAAAPSGPGVVRRSFALNTFTINDQSMDMSRVDTVIDHDGPELWTVTNENDDWPHNFHIHDARFKVVEFDGQGIDVPHAGWKDTVDLPPKATATLLVEFGHYPDATIPYMYHCHMLLHEDEGMMGQFVIVNRGQAPDVRVDPAALVFDTKQSGHAGHAGVVIDSSRSPYASESAAPATRLR